MPDDQGMKVVVVEDSLPAPCLLVRQLAKKGEETGEEAGAALGTATGAEDAVRLVVEGLPDVVLLDLKLSPGAGLWVLAKLRARGFGGRIYVFSLDDRDAYANLCRLRGADGFFDKAELGALVPTLQPTLQPTLLPTHGQTHR